MNIPLFSFDVLYRKGLIYMTLGRFEELDGIIEQQGSLFKSIPREDSYHICSSIRYIIKHVRF